MHTYLATPEVVICQSVGPDVTLISSYWPVYITKSKGSLDEKTLLDARGLGVDVLCRRESSVTSASQLHYPQIILSLAFFPCGVCHPCEISYGLTRRLGPTYTVIRCHLFSPPGLHADSPLTHLALRAFDAQGPMPLCEAFSPKTSCPSLAKTKKRLRSASTRFDFAKMAKNR